MENNEQNSSQAFENAFKENLNQVVSQAPSTQSIEPKHRKKSILILGFSMSIILIAVGILVYIIQPDRTSSNRNVKDVENEIATLDSEIDQLYEEESKIFEESGFSSAYYDAADKTAEKVEQKYNLKNDLNAKKGKNTINTGAIWFFIASGIIALLSLIIFFIKA